MKPKTHLSLNKRWRRRTSKRILPTPVKSPGSKRRKFSTPRQTPTKYVSNTSQCKKSPVFIATKLQSSCNPYSPSNQWMDIDETEIPQKELENYMLFKEHLKDYDLWEHVQIFIDLVAKQKFPLDNIALLLFLDTVQFFGCKTTSQMNYFTETKRFWKTGYRLFRGKFLYFMGGPKHAGTKEDREQDYLDPLTAKINFAVPSVHYLEKFDITETLLPKRMPTGMIEPILESIAKSVYDKRFMLCADAKKVTAGIDKVGGDVDMFGFEDGESLELRQNELAVELKILERLEEDIVNSTDVLSPDVVVKLRDIVTVIGRRIQKARELKSKQEFGLSKFLFLGGEKWRESKYVYAISAFQTCLYRINEFLHSALHTIQRLCQSISTSSNAKCTVPEDLVVMKGHQTNMVFLNPNFQVDILEPMYILQRSPVWFEIRKLASVTGSTLHDAIGLRGLQQQKKHISKLFSTDADTETLPEDALVRMEYGTKNEGNALATIAAVVLPTFFPNYIYVEEGCYVIQGDKKDILMVISPDGSLREYNQELRNESDIGKVMAAVEVKCPYPNQNKVTLHYNLPQYYVCQCLAEMYALKTDRLIYLSWSPESSAVLEVLFDENLFAKIFSLVKDTYDNESPKRLPQTPGRLKEIKEEISKFQKSHVRFLGEVPSASMYSTNEHTAAEFGPYIFPITQPSLIETIAVNDPFEVVISAVKRSTETIELAYDLQRRRASEVMVWVLTHVDRDTKTELPCSLPIAFGLKDYRLTSQAFRNATDFVIEKCQEKGLQICSFSTDGQWIQLMTRDKNGTPLTILQLQKDIWTKAQKRSKIDICKYFVGLNRVNNRHDNILDNVQWEKRNGTLYLRGKDPVAKYVKTPDSETLRRVLTKRIVKENGSIEVTLNEPNTVESALNHILSPEESTNAVWTPDHLINVMEQSVDYQAEEDLQVIETSVEYGNENPKVFDDHGHNHSGVSCNDNCYGSIPCQLEISDMGNQDENYSNANQPISASCISDKECGKTLVNYNILAETIVDNLRKDSNVNLSTADLKSMFRFEKPFSSLTHKILDIVIQATLVATNSTEVLRTSWNKERKIALLMSLVSGKEPTPSTEKQVRRKNPSSLSNLCQHVIRSTKMPKPLLNVVYASCIHDMEFKCWLSKMPMIPLPDMYDENGERLVPFWYSYPEISNSNTIGKSLDCSHNLTHLRVRSCTTGIGDVSSEAWKVVSRKNETKLSTALVEDLIDKQSVPNARTNFSEEVEDCMRKYGYSQAADLTRLIRNWYEACDAPGISASTRVRSLIAMRQFLLCNVNFGKYPPQARYLNKIPIVTFEGILIDIDTKIQLHSYVGPYNIRSVGSLAAETTVGILQQLSPVSSVSIKARDVPSLVANVVEVMTSKLNPNRGFYMRTSRHSGIYPTYEDDTCIHDKPDSGCADTSECLTIRNHPFDKPKRGNAKRRIRFGTVSGPTAPARGALPVRQFHRKDESKILPSKRLGISLFLNNNVHLELEKHEK